MKIYNNLIWFIDDVNKYNVSKSYNKTLIEKLLTTNIYDINIINFNKSNYNYNVEYSMHMYMYDNFNINTYYYLENCNFFKCDIIIKNYGTIKNVIIATQKSEKSVFYKKIWILFIKIDGLNINILLNNYLKNNYGKNTIFESEHVYNTINLLNYYYDVLFTDKYGLI